MQQKNANNTRKLELPKLKLDIRAAAAIRGGQSVAKAGTGRGGHSTGRW